MPDVDSGRSAEAADYHHMRILVVESDPAVGIKVRAMLKQDGYDRVTAVASAEEAFAALGLGQGRKPAADIADLILMDLDRPGRIGWAAVRRINRSSILRDIPIIGVTASEEERHLSRAFRAGVVDYIRKPFSKSELSARVRSSLVLKDEMDRRKAREQDLLRVTRDLQQANRKLELLSMVDQVTGLANRRRFDEALHEEWLRGVRSGAPLALVMIDIDFFKAYNDRYGHQTGDMCLGYVCSAIRSVVRRPGDLVARYGGEEIAALLPNTTLAGARVLAESMRKAVECLNIPHVGSSVSPWVTLSAGVAFCVPDTTVPPAELVAQADRALYRAKAEGRNRWEG